MSRKTFLARESFVDAAAIPVWNTLLSLPPFIEGLQLTQRNPLIETLQFSYEGPTGAYVFTVTVLTLNEQYTRVSLHASFADGHSFHSDANIGKTIEWFERMLHAALKGELQQFLSVQEGRKSRRGESGARPFWHWLGAPFLLRKKLS